MNKITAKDVANLRAATGAGILDCKKALEAAAGNFEEATKWLRKRGIAKAAKKLDRMTNEGIVFANAIGPNAAIIEVKCETDFVAKNKKFQDFVEFCESLVRKHSLHTPESLLGMIHNQDITVAAELANLSGTIGEKLEISRTQAISAPNDTIGVYNHSNNKISVVAVLEGKVDIEVARNIAMHVAAISPKYIDKTNIPPAEIQEEKQQITQKTLEENEKLGPKRKPDNVINKMIEGRLNKVLSENCLVEQPYVKDPSQKVKNYLQKHKTSVLKIVRYQLA